MALSSHELYLVLRARDEASRVLQQFSRNMSDMDSKAKKAAQAQFARGQALATLGVGIAAAGLAGLAVINDMTDAAMAYTQQVASTATQLDEVNISMAELSDMGKRVASDVPLAFDQMQLGLYDIFSSIDTNAAGAEVLLRGISKAAVGGQVGIQEAGRATIAILNAYKRPAEDVNEVNDIMFELVRKGIGTFGEFTANIGKSIPSAVKAGQSFESLAGMLAFLTRNGLSVAMSSTSAARALDAMAKPATIARFEEMGVEVTKANGEFRPMAEIMTDLRGKMAGMSAEAKASKLNELFKGSGGTLQAMRFFNLAMDDSNGLLQSLTGHMNTAEGAADEAYKIMSNTPQAKLQALSNQYEIMKVSIGEHLLPAKVKLIEVITSLLEKFSNLSPGVQKAIAMFLGFGSVILVLVGIVVTITGIILMFKAALVIAGVSFMAIAGPVMIVIAALIALGVAIFFIIKYWDEIKAAAGVAWDWIVTKVEQAVEWIKAVFISMLPTFLDIWNKIQAVWRAGVDVVMQIWNELVAIFGPTVDKIAKDLPKAFAEIARFAKEVFNNILQAGGAIADFAQVVWDKIVQAGKAVADFAMKIWDLMSPQLMSMWTTLKEAISSAMATIMPVIKSFGDTWTAMKPALTNVFNFIYAIVKWVFEALWVIIKNAVGLISGVLQALWAVFKVVFGLIVILFQTVIWPVFKVLVTVITGAFMAIWDVVENIVKPVFNFIAEFIRATLVVIKGIFDVFAGLFTGDWGRMWDGIKGILVGIWDAIYAVLKGAIGLVIGIVRGLIEGIIGFFVHLWDALVGHSIIPDMINAIVDWFKSLPGKVLAFILTLIVRAVAFFISLHNKVISTVRDFIDNAVDFFQGLPGRVLRAVAGLASQLYRWARGAWQQARVAAAQRLVEVVRLARDLPGRIIRAVGDLGRKLYYAGRDLIRGLINGITSMARSAATAAVNAASSAWNAAKNFLGISSPSKLFMEVGLMTGEGFVVGIERMIKDVARSGANLAQAAASNVDPVVPGFAGPGGNDFGRRPPFDLSEDARATTPTVEVTVNTQEIDPIKHAADLGFEIARRIGV